MYMHTNACMHECVTLHCTQNGVKLITKANGTAAAAANNSSGRRLCLNSIMCGVHTGQTCKCANTNNSNNNNNRSNNYNCSYAVPGSTWLSYCIFFLSLSREFVQIKSDGNCNTRVGIMPVSLPLSLPRCAISIIIARVARVAIGVVVFVVFRFLFAACCCCRRLLFCFMRPQNVLQSHDSQQQQ